MFVIPASFGLIKKLELIITASRQKVKKKSPFLPPAWGWFTLLIMPPPRFCPRPYPEDEK
jgi:hypothetical protein